MIPRHRVTHIASSIFFILLCGYGYFEARSLMSGPIITIENVPTYSLSRLVTIEGLVRNSSSLWMNGEQVQITETGKFSEQYAPTTGYNRITLEARDRYGKTAYKTIEIVYAASSTESHASSTASTTPSAATSTP